MFYYKKIYIFSSLPFSPPISRVKPGGFSKNIIKTVNYKTRWPKDSVTLGNKVKTETYFKENLSILSKIDNFSLFISTKGVVIQLSPFPTYIIINSVSN